MKREAILRPSVVLAVAVTSVIVGTRFLNKRSEKGACHGEAQQRLSSLAAQHNAVTDWQSRFDHRGVKIGDGHRAVYTSDVVSAVLREDGRPLLIVGHVFEVTKEAQAATLGVKAFEYPDLNFVLSCTSGDADVVLTQPTDRGDLFAVVAAVASVSRPGFETDAWVESEGDDVYAEIIVEPGDQYILRGRCLAIVYIGNYAPD